MKNTYLIIGYTMKGKALLSIGLQSNKEHRHYIFKNYYFIKYLMSTVAYSELLKE